MMLFLAACLFTPLSAQLKLGLRIGMSTTLLEANEVEVPSPGGSSFLDLDIDQLHFGIHGGLVVLRLNGQRDEVHAAGFIFGLQSRQRLHDRGPTDANLAGQLCAFQFGPAGKLAPNDS